MLARVAFVVLSCAVLSGCSGGDDGAGSAVKAAADWAKVGETDNYVYYADYGSIKKADETVVMADLFDYKTPQTDGGPAALSKVTQREYDCQAKKSQPLKSSWYSGQMGSGTAVRSANSSNQWSPANPGTATAGLLKAACGA